MPGYNKKKLKNIKTEDGIFNVMYHLTVDGRIILRGIFRKWEGIVGTGWSGLRIGRVGGHL
jgi:hypothetical protein